jgi:hypothetical protein
MYGSARSSVRQYSSVRECGSVRQCDSLQQYCALQCATERHSVQQCEWQCAAVWSERQCMAVRAAACAAVRGSAAVYVRQ